MFLVVSCQVPIGECQSERLHEHPGRQRFPQVVLRVVRVVRHEEGKMILQEKVNAQVVLRVGRQVALQKMEKGHSILQNSWDVQDGTVPGSQETAPQVARWSPRTIVLESHLEKSVVHPCRLVVSGVCHSGLWAQLSMEPMDWSTWSSPGPSVV